MTSIADTICATLALPDEFPALRVSDSYACTPSAVTKVNLDLKVNWQAATDQAECPGNDINCFMFRDPLRWLVIRQPNTDHNTSKYLWRPDGINTVFPIVGGTNGAITKINVSCATAAASSQWKPHGDTLFAGDAHGDAYLWIDKGSTITLLFTAGGGSETGSAQLYMWNHGYKQAILTQNAVADGTTLNTIPALAQSGYYHLEFGFKNAHVVTINTVDTTGVPSWSHYSVPDMAANCNRVQAYSMTASSLLWRNTASYDNAQGSVGAVVIGPGYEWWQLAYAGGGYNVLSNNFNSGWKSFFAGKGIYAWLKPSDEEDVEFKFNTRCGTPGDLSTWSYARFNLLSTSNYIAFAMSVSSTLGRDTLVRAAAHIQYESNDAWADLRTPEANVDDWLSAVKQLTYVPNITENPVHMKEILNAVGKVGLAFNNIQTRLAPIVSAGAAFVPGGAVLAKIGSASLPYQKKGWQYLADYGERKNVDPRQED